MIGTESGNGHGNLSAERETASGTTLQPWQEVVGNLECAFYSEQVFEVHIKVKNGLARLVFHKDSPEAKQTRDVLLNLPRGSRIALLKTDSAINPILIRTVPE